MPKLNIEAYFGLMCARGEDAALVDFDLSSSRQRKRLFVSDCYLQFVREKGALGTCVI